MGYEYWTCPVCEEDCALIDTGKIVILDDRMVQVLQCAECKSVMAIKAERKGDEG